MSDDDHRLDLELVVVARTFEVHHRGSPSARPSSARSGWFLTIEGVRVEIETGRLSAPLGRDDRRSVRRDQGWLVADVVR